MFHHLIEDMGLPLIKLLGKEPDEGTTWKGKGCRSYEEIGLNEDCNAGVVTGAPSGIIVLDIDTPELFPIEFTVPNTSSAFPATDISFTDNFALILI